MRFSQIKCAGIPCSAARENTKALCKRHFQAIYKACHADFEGKRADEDAITKMLSEQRFETKFLFTTKCFDAGANLRDKAIKTIIIDMFDVSDIIQCVGRKRIIDSSDSYDLYIHRYDNKIINGWKSDRQKKINIAELYLTDKSEYDKFYGRNDSSGMIYVSEKNGNTTIYNFFLTVKSV